MRTRVNLPNEIDDTTGMAGWMYSDLLVALMVIFLATITFVPQVNGSAASGSKVTTNNQKPVYNYFEYYDKPLVKVYNSFNIDYIKQDIDNFLITERLPINSFIGSIQIVGGYDILTETASQAVDRAINFSELMDQSDPRLLARASTTISSTTNISSNQVVLRMIFVVNYSVTN